jgi:serine/threonine protein kinase
MAEIVHFLRSRDYILIKELGQGACGKTVLLDDDQIGQHFVCKKYSPYDENEREALFINFVREIKLLHLLQHNNVVRVFNYYLYPDKVSGYILMEYVDGEDIEDFTAEFPDKLNDLFTQAIDGFSYLERSGVLHRDIRAGNLLVSSEGILKIIDLGFGKRVNTSLDFDKSITLNWWCATPDEFRFKRYDFTTEVYFVGKLFEQLIDANIQLRIIKRTCMLYLSRRLYAATHVAPTSEYLSTPDSSEQGSGEGWGLPCSQTPSRGDTEFARPYQRRVVDNPASAALKGLPVAAAVSGRGRGRSAGRISIGTAIGTNRQATAEVGRHP